MGPERRASDPLDQLQERLESWCWRAFLRFSPLVEEKGAVALVEALISEYLGRRLDELAPEGFRNGLGSAYGEMREFFERFAPDVAAYLPRKALPESLERLREIQLAMCGRIVQDHPATLGRCGRTLLSREWKEMEATLPVLEEALRRLACAPEGLRVEDACRAELEAILGDALSASRDVKRLLDLRRRSRRSLTQRLGETGAET